jgi:hypothetical protein
MIDLENEVKQLRKIMEDTVEGSGV